MRVEGWERKLNELVENARHKEYSIGRYDCAIFVVDVISALTGVDHSLRVKGRYATKKGAYELIKRLSGGGRGELRDAVSTVLNTPPVYIGRAQRGDPVLYQDSTGQEHLGIHLGSSVAVLGESGLLLISPKQCICGWNT